MDAPRLTVRQLGCERDHRMLFQDLAFSARNGEIWQVTGANGAGKTTLLRILVGLHGLPGPGGMVGAAVPVITVPGASTRRA